MTISREKSEFLRRERDTWVALGEEKMARALAEERLLMKSTEATDLRCRCSELENEAQEARERVAPLEEKIDFLRDALGRESQERSADAGRYQDELARVEALLAKQDETLVQMGKDLTEAYEQITLWRGRAETQEEEIKGSVF